MANIVKYEDIQVPAHLQNRKPNTDSFLAGISQGKQFPTIGCKGTRFLVKQDGTETVLPTMEIGVVLLGAKPNLDKSYYATAYDPNSTEFKAPDCSSDDGIKPRADSPLKQCESCAGCPQNQFGSGKDASGNPGKGKACSDRKQLAIYANNGIYGFSIPPASLKAFVHYVKETSRRGVDLSTAITVIGFDANFSYPVLTFNFGGFLGPEQVAKTEVFAASPEVAEIVAGTPSGPSAAKQIEEKPAPAPAPDPFASMGGETVAPPAEKPKAVRAVKPKEKVVETVVEAEDDELAALAAELGL